MKAKLESFVAEHVELSRRYFLRSGAAGVAALGAWPLAAHEPSTDPGLREAIERLESFLTSQEEFRDVSRGKPIPHTLPEEKRHEVGLARERPGSWKWPAIRTTRRASARR
jgi:hypothetical protein